MDETGRGGLRVGNLLVACNIASLVGPFKTSSDKFSFAGAVRISNNINLSVTIEDYFILFTAYVYIATKTRR